MSIDIDIKSYAGAVSDPAAVDQSVLDTNSYAQEAQDSPLGREFDQAPQGDDPIHQAPSNPQAEHFRQLREEVDRIKAERVAEKQEHQLQLDMLRANMQNAQKPQEAKEERIFHGMKDDDVPNVAEFRREWEQREQAYQSRLEELQVQQMYPDYMEVIEKFALPLVKQKPHLAEGIQGARNKALFAYELGNMARQMQGTQQATQKSETAQRIVDNSRKPGTLSQAGGQAALSKADYFATMSDNEFMKFASKNLEGI